MDDFVLEERPLPPIRDRDLDTVLDIVLRYADTLRGPEADRIIAFLEEDGYVALALHDLRSRGQWRRARAAERLGRMRSPRAVPFLISAMQDDSADVRVVAARACHDRRPARHPQPGGCTRRPVALDRVQCGQ